MEQNFLKITYHTGLKKLNAYLKMPSPTYFVLKKEIEMCLFEERNQPRCEIRTFWIDDDEDEIEIINQCDYDIFLTKRSKHQHMQVAPINEVTREKPDNNANKSNAVTDSVSSDAKVPPADGSYEFAVHERVECDGCLMAPIIGFRYKCIQCPNYDLCQNCESKHVHSEHMMVRMPTNNCPNVIDAYVTGRSSGRKHSKRSKASCPFIKTGLSVAIDDEVENSKAANGVSGDQSSPSSSKERHHGRKHQRRHHRNNFLSHLYEMMHDLAEGGGAAAAEHATGEFSTSSETTTAGPHVTTTTLIIDDNGTKSGPHTTTTSFTSDGNATTTASSNTTTTFTSPSGYENVKTNTTNTTAAAAAAAKAAELAAKVAHETAAQAAKKITENLTVHVATSAGPHTATAFTSASGLGNVENNAATAAAAAAAQFAAQQAHATATKASEIANKVAHETAVQAAKKITENLTGNAATFGPRPTTIFTNTSGSENAEKNTAANAAAAAAAQFAAQQAHETAAKASEIASKVAHETAMQAAKKITENLTGNAATFGPRPTTIFTNTSSFENAGKNTAASAIAAAAAQFAAQKAHETAAEIATKAAHETAINAAKTIQENLAAAGVSTPKAAAEENESKSTKDKAEAATSPCGNPKDQPNNAPFMPSPSLEAFAQILDPQYMKTGIQILNNFSDMFAKMLDPMDKTGERQTDSRPFSTDSRKNSTTSTKSFVSSNLNSMSSDNSEKEKIEKENIEQNKENKQTESEAPFNIEIDDLGSDSENDSVSDSFIKLDAPKEPNKEDNNLIEATSSVTAATSAQTTPPQTLNMSNVMDFAQLSANLKAHIAEEAAKSVNAGTGQTENIAASTTITSTTAAAEPVVTTSSTTTSISANTESNSNGEKRATPVFHPDQRINNAVQAMMSMGFSNEGAWLTQLLESVNGNISEALDLMSAAQRR